MKFLRYPLLSSLIFFSFQSFGEGVPSTQGENPRAVIEAHLYFLHPDHYDLEQAAKSFHPSIPVSRRERLAIQTKQILDARVALLNLKRISNRPDFTDSISGEHIAEISALVPEIYLEKIGKRWYYSMQTSRRIPDIHQSIYPYGMSKLMEIIPHERAQWRFLGVFGWQWFGIMFLLLICLVFHFIFRFILSKLTEISADRLYKGKLPHHLALAVAEKASLFILFSFLIIMLPLLDLPRSFGSPLIFISSLFKVYFATYTFIKIINVLGYYLNIYTAKTESKMDDILAPMAVKILHVIVWGIGVAVFARKLEFDLTALIAGVSIGGLAIALAAQDSLKNLFGSLLIFLDKPFQVGDWVISDKFDGMVEDVGFRSTRIRSFNNSLITVPNAHVADSAIDNLGQRQFRRFRTNITITYDTPPFLIEIFVEGIRRIILSRSDIRETDNYVYLTNLGSTSLEILLQVYFINTGFENELKAKHAIISEIIVLAEKLGVRFAFPTQTIHIEDMPGQESKTPTYEKDPGDYRKILEDHFSKNDTSNNEREFGE